MEAENKVCLSCQKKIKGRTDKKFCDDHCRSAYNNGRNSRDNNYIRHINYALRRNRRILEELLPAEASTVKTLRHQLQCKGFLFEYFTHVHTNRKGGICYFCYDHGYLPLSQDRLLIIRKKQHAVLK